MLNERLNWWWLPLLNGNGMMLDKFEDGEYWRLPWSLSSLTSDTFWSLSLKRSLTNAPCPDDSLEDIRSSVAVPRWIEEMRFGPARHSTDLIQGFDQLKELLLLQDKFSEFWSSFQKMKWFRASAVVLREMLCAWRLKSSLRVWLILRKSCIKCLGRGDLTVRA